MTPPPNGVHLEPVGLYKWRLTGVNIVYLTREEIHESIRWLIENGGIVFRYATLPVALAHAYQLAKGHTPRESEKYG